MLFTHNDAARNSLINARERNLYFKILGGFVFNELISDPPIDQRIKAFLEIVPKKLPNIKDKVNHEQKNLRQLLDLNINPNEYNSALSFDNHLLKDTKLIEDTPEFADIALWLPENKLIAIEAKYTQNWKAKEDVYSNLARINCTLNQSQTIGFHKYGIERVVFVLLILERKLIGQVNRTDSVLKQINQIELDKHGISACIITWEAIMRKLEETFHGNLALDKVSSYFNCSKIEMENQKRI